MAKVKIPKKIAGVKIPKKARKQANRALKAADNPFVRGLATAALASAAQAGRIRAPRASVHVGVDGDALVEAVRDAARNGLRAFLEGLEQGLSEGPAARDDDPPGFTYTH